MKEIKTTTVVLLIVVVVFILATKWMSLETHKQELEVQLEILRAAQEETAAEAEALREMERMYMQELMKESK